MKTAGSAGKGLTIRTLGPMGIERDGVDVTVPASRKARAILGYLILSPRPVGRQRLCEMFFDIPDDPRASLRWVLTKLRGVTDDDAASRIVSSGDALKFEAAGASVDVLDVLAGAGDPLEAPGLFLEDAELPDRQDFSIWLHGARDEVRAASVQRVRRAVEAEGSASDRKLSLFRRWLALDPADEAASVGVVQTLAQLGRADEARDAAAGAERALARAGVKAGAALRGALKVSSEPVVEAPISTASGPVRTSSPAQLIAQAPGVAILPFHNYSPDLIPDVLMDGLLESTLHMFSRFRSFRTSSLDTVMAFAGKMNDPAALRAATGADYIVGGSVMARNSTVKVRYRIVDAASGALASSGDIERTVDASGAAILEEIPETLVAYLIHQIYEVTRHKAAAIPEDQRNAMQHLYCGMSYGFLSPPLDYQKALDCFEKALELHPDFPAAKACSAWAKALLGRWYTEPGNSEAIGQAKWAIAHGNDDANTLAIAAWSLVQLGGDIDLAKRAMDIAIGVNPLARAAWNISAWIRSMAGEYETPMEHWRRAEKNSPLGAGADQTNSGRALCSWQAGKYEDAAMWARRALDRAPNNPGALTAAVAAAVELGDKEAIRATAKLLLDQYPAGVDSPVIYSVPLRAPGVKERILAAVKRGLEMAKA